MVYLNQPEMYVWFIQLLPQIDIREFSIDDVDVGPPLDQADG